MESDDERVIGYVVATDDTNAFATWFRDEWWPSRARATAAPRGEPPRRTGSSPTATGWRRARIAIAREYPAHLHIDLLPETQGRDSGGGSSTRCSPSSAAAALPVCTSAMNADNAAAGAFYERLGFERLASGDGSTTYGIRIPAPAA